MAETNAMVNASNSRVKPPPSCAHGTLTFLTPHLVQHWTIVSVAVRAIEAAAHDKVDTDVEPTRRRIEVDAGYPPWRHKTQCQLQQGWCRTWAVSPLSPRSA